MFSSHARSDSVHVTEKLKFSFACRAEKNTSEMFLTGRTKGVAERVSEAGEFPK